MGARLCLYAHAQPFYCGLDSAGAARNPECTERHLYNTEGAEHHRGVVVTHVSNAEGLAVQSTKPASKLVMLKAGITSVGEKHGCHSVGALAGFCNIEFDCFSSLPN
jgi:hypothetical protein